MRRHLPLFATALTLAILFGVAAFRYEGFMSGRTIVNLFIDNAALGMPVTINLGYAF